MVSLKLLVLVIFVTSVASNPHFLHHHHGKHGHPLKSISTCIGHIFKNLKPSPKICDKKTQEDLFKPRKPKDIHEVIKFLIQLSQGVGGIMDKHYNGLGSLVTRIVIALSRISTCKLGAKKFHKAPQLCSCDFPQFGVKGIGRDTNDICSRFKVDNATKQVNDYINTYTKNKGINSVKGTVKVFFQVCLNLAAIIDNRSSIDVNIFSRLIIQVSIAVGSIGNGYKHSLGRKVAIPFIRTCHPIIINFGFPGIIDKIETVKNTINVCNGQGGPVSGPDANTPVEDHDSDDWDDSGEQTDQKPKDDCPKPKEDKPKPKPKEDEPKPKEDEPKPKPKEDEPKPKEDGNEKDCHDNPSEPTPTEPTPKPQEEPDHGSDPKPGCDDGPQDDDRPSPCPDYDEGYRQGYRKGYKQGYDDSKHDLYKTCKIDCN